MLNIIITFIDCDKYLISLLILQLVVNYNKRGFGSLPLTWCSNSFVELMFTFLLMFDSSCFHAQSLYCSHSGALYFINDEDLPNEVMLLMDRTREGLMCMLFVLFFSLFFCSFSFSCVFCFYSTFYTKR